MKTKIVMLIGYLIFITIQASAQVVKTKDQMAKAGKSLVDVMEWANTIGHGTTLILRIDNTTRQLVNLKDLGQKINTLANSAEFKAYTKFNAEGAYVMLNKARLMAYRVGALSQTLLIIGSLTKVFNKDMTNYIKEETGENISTLADAATFLGVGSSSSVKVLGSGVDNTLQQNTSSVTEQQLLKQDLRKRDSKEKVILVLNKLDEIENDLQNIYFMQMAIYQDMLYAMYAGKNFLLADVNSYYYKNWLAKKMNVIDIKDKKFMENYNENTRKETAKNKEFLTNIKDFQGLMNKQSAVKMYYND